MSTITFDPLAYKQSTREQWQRAAGSWHRWGSFLENWLRNATASSSVTAHSLALACVLPLFLAHLLSTDSSEDRVDFGFGLGSPAKDGGRETRGVSRIQGRPPRPMINVQVAEMRGRSRRCCLVLPPQFGGYPRPHAGPD